MRVNGKVGGVNEERFVVEITRPVSPDKVAAVAERIASRLRLDLDRIHTLIDGRVGPVTRPVLAEKADSIAEVFAEAGVRVIVVGAQLSAPPESSAAAADTTLEDSSGQQPQPSEGAAEQSADPQPSSPEPEPHDLEPHAVAGQGEGSHEVEAHDAELQDVELSFETEPTSTTPTGPAVSWDPSTAWDAPEIAVDEWSTRQGERSSSVTPRIEVTPDPTGVAEPEDLTDDPAHAPEATEGGQYNDYDEDEADRLGPDAGRSTTPERMFTTSTRWMPSPHDTYGFDPDEEGFTPTEEEATSAASGYSAASDYQEEYFEPRGYDVPEWRGGYPRRQPSLRTYLLWSLAVSVVVLILLQIVFAARGDVSSEGFDYDVALRAYQQGDFARAIRIWEPLAAEGEPRAQYQLGFMAQHGLGQPWSNSRAANYYRRAAEAGLPEAQLALGELYLRGLGVEQDAETAVRWYHRAAESGYAAAQYRYALQLLHGEGVEQQFDEALTWLEAASAGGVDRAANLVAFVKAAPSANQH